MNTTPNSVSNVAPGRVSTRQAGALLPAVDVIEDTQGITLHADLPGVPAAGLKIEVVGNTLSIAGDIAIEDSAAVRFTHTEVNLPRYLRVFTLSEELDPDKVEASFAQGLLTLRIPKAEQAQPRKIEIRTS